MADGKVSSLDIELVEKWVVRKADVMAESTAATKGDEVAAKMAERLAGSMVLQSVVAMVSVWVG